MNQGEKVPRKETTWLNIFKVFVKEEERRKCVYLQLRKMLLHLWLFSTIWRNILCSSVTVCFVSYTQIENTSVKKPISTFEYFSRFLARGNKLPDSIDEDFSQDFLLSKSWCNEVKKKKRWINEREEEARGARKASSPRVHEVIDRSKLIITPSLPPSSYPQGKDLFEQLNPNQRSHQFSLSKTGKQEIFVFQFPKIYPHVERLFTCL